MSEKGLEPVEPLTDEVVLATSRLPLNEWAKVRCVVDKPSPTSEDVEVRVDIGGTFGSVALWGTCLHCSHLDGYGIAPEREEGS